MVLLLLIFGERRGGERGEGCSLGPIYFVLKLMPRSRFMAAAISNSRGRAKVPTGPMILILSRPSSSISASIRSRTSRVWSESDM